MSRQPDYEALGLRREQDPDWDEARAPGEPRWRYVTDDGYRVERITGSRFVWMVIPPRDSWHTGLPTASNLTRAADTIARLRRATAPQR